VSDSFRPLAGLSKREPLLGAHNNGMATGVAGMSPSLPVCRRCFAWRAIVIAWATFPALHAITGAVKTQAKARRPRSGRQLRPPQATMASRVTRSWMPMISSEQLLTRRATLHRGRH